MLYCYLGIGISSWSPPNVGASSRTLQHTQEKLGRFSSTPVSPRSTGPNSFYLYRIIFHYFPSLSFSFFFLLTLSHHFLWPVVDFVTLESFRPYLPSNDGSKEEGSTLHICSNIWHVLGSIWKLGCFLYVYFISFWVRHVHWNLFFSRRQLVTIAVSVQWWRLFYL